MPVRSRSLNSIYSINEAAYVLSFSLVGLSLNQNSANYSQIFGIKELSLER